MHCQGDIDVRILKAPLEEIPSARGPAHCGAECIFLGRTRADVHPEHGELIELAYETHEPLALVQMQQLCEEAMSMFEVFSIGLHHAIGVVGPGDASVRVQIFAGHRAASFDASRWIMNALKQRVPIWKREVWADGTTWSTGQPVEAPEIDS